MACQETLEYQVDVQAKLLLEVRIQAEVVDSLLYLCMIHANRGHPLVFALWSIYLDYAFNVPLNFQFELRVVP